jgi:hypothetical protein
MVLLAQTSGLILPRVHPALLARLLSPGTSSASIKLIILADELRGSHSKKTVFVRHSANNLKTRHISFQLAFSKLDVTVKCSNYLFHKEGKISKPNWFSIQINLKASKN